MPRNPSNYTRALQQLARQFVKQLPSDRWDPSAKRAIMTSLVRQWLTCDGKALLLDAEHHYVLQVRQLTANRYEIAAETGERSPLDDVVQKWGLRLEDVDRVQEELNLQQSAEFTDNEGLAYRLSVDPREVHMKLELLTEPVAAVPVSASLLQGIAEQILDRYLSPRPAAETLPELARSLVRQWTAHQGRGAVVAENNCYWIQAVPTSAEDGKGQVDCTTPGLVGLLQSWGIVVESLTDILQRLNLTQTADFNDRQGLSYRVWVDVEARSLKLTMPASVAVQRPFQNTIGWWKP